MQAPVDRIFYSRWKCWLFLGSGLTLLVPTLIYALLHKDALASALSGRLNFLPEASLAHDLMREGLFYFGILVMAYCVYTLARLFFAFSTRLGFGCRPAVEFWPDRLVVRNGNGWFELRRGDFQGGFSQGRGLLRQAIFLVDNPAKGMPQRNGTGVVDFELPLASQGKGDVLDSVDAWIQQGDPSAQAGEAAKASGCQGGFGRRKKG